MVASVGPGKSGLSFRKSLKKTNNGTFGKKMRGTEPPAAKVGRRRRLGCPKRYSRGEKAPPRDRGRGPKRKKKKKLLMMQIFIISEEKVLCVLERFWKYRDIKRGGRQPQGEKSDTRGGKWGPTRQAR